MASLRATQARACDVVADARIRSSPAALILSTVLIGAMGLIGPTGCGGDDADAPFPAENGLIAFAGDEGSGAEIYTISADGSGLRKLTALDGDAGAPDFSPDAARIAFWVEAEPEHAGVYVMNADGSDLRRVSALGGQPVFTPAGDQLVYWCADCPGGDGVFVMRDDGSDAPGTRLTTNPFHEGDEDPEVSPDGETVTFVRHKVAGELQALFAVDIGGSNLRQLTSYRREVAITHDWAPDGDQIVITTNADYPDHKSPNVATMRPDGSDLRLLTDYAGGEQGAFAGSYSPDGRWIVFRVENLEREKFGLYRMYPDGTHRTLIKALPFSPRQSDWGSRPASDDSSESAATTTTPVEENATVVDAELVGEWKTENVCQEQLRALQEAGLDDDLIREWVEFPGRKPTCRGARPAEHSHVFGKDGSLASYAQNGEQVNYDGSYTQVDDRTFTLGSPPVTVHYRIEGDEATFDVVIPDCKSKRCEESTAYVVSVFFPRRYERAD